MKGEMEEGGIMLLSKEVVFWRLCGFALTRIEFPAFPNKKYSKIYRNR